MTLKREIIYRGGLPHLSGLPHLPGVPHLHVNRALGSTRSHRDLAKSRRVLGEISFISPKCLSSRRDLVAISSHWVLGEISFISQKSLSYRRDLICLAKISFNSSRPSLGEIWSVSRPRSLSSRADLRDITNLAGFSSRFQIRACVLAWLAREKQSILTSQPCLHTLMQTRLSDNQSARTILVIL